MLKVIVARDEDGSLNLFLEKPTRHIPNSNNGFWRNEACESISLPHYHELGDFLCWKDEPRSFEIVDIKHLDKSLRLNRK